LTDLWGEKFSGVETFLRVVVQHSEFVGGDFQFRLDGADRRINDRDRDHADQNHTDAQRNGSVSGEMSRHFLQNFILFFF